MVTDLDLYEVVRFTSGTGADLRSNYFVPHAYNGIYYPTTTIICLSGLGLKRNHFMEDTSCSLIAIHFQYRGRLNSGKLPSGRGDFG